MPCFTSYVQDAGRKVIWQVLLTWLENLKHSAVHWTVSGSRADISELLQQDDTVLVGHESSIKDSFLEPYPDY